ncbi:hypothetical protein NECAME_03430 [Necator americanus]|uniref:Uncharacterized protein n=1 Tax=Necator americanus TaxID=51031 RepID=W2T3M0_NECAM|nr:hypothetical protein NECAME_03430 [Necator americanus]ETN76498.1 hypothetical protein NECAME_03430 [Necator americanus]
MPMLRAKLLVKEKRLSSRHLIHYLFEQNARSRVGAVEVAVDNHGISQEHHLGKSNGIGSASEKDLTRSDGEDSSGTPKKKLERKSSLPTEDEKTTSLIRKQMSEIEKEITRRSQNKNIKKLETWLLPMAMTAFEGVDLVKKVESVMSHERKLIKKTLRRK